MTDNAELNEIESQDEILNNEPEIIEPERVSAPWENPPKDAWFYDYIAENGRIAGLTQLAYYAYKHGYFDHQISEDQFEQSEIDMGFYLKSKCPHKTVEDHLKDEYRLEIQQLKKQLSDTDYKAIKFAEGQISESEYAPVKAERQGYRDRINYLEGLL